MSGEANPGPPCGHCGRAGCWYCHLVATRADYRALWGGRPAPAGAGLLLAAEDCGVIDGLWVALARAGGGWAGGARGLRAEFTPDPGGGVLRLAGVCRAEIRVGWLVVTPKTGLGAGRATGGSDCPPGAVIEALIVDGWEP